MTRQMRFLRTREKSLNRQSGRIKSILQGDVPRTISLWQSVGGEAYLVGSEKNFLEDISA